MRLTDDNLRGRTIISADGQVIGEITALFLDSDTWQVESLQVQLGKEVADLLGAERGVFHAGTLELPSHMVQSVGDTVVLAVSIDALRDVQPPMAGRDHGAAAPQLQATHKA